MEISVEGWGLRQKLHALQTLIEFFENAPYTAAAFLAEAIITGVINGQYVGVITGNLKRSVDVAEVDRFTAAIVSDLSMAPYSIEVREKNLKKYGEDFYQIGLRIYGEEAARMMAEEWEKAIKAINERKPYKFSHDLVI